MIAGHSGREINKVMLPSRGKHASQNGNHEMIIIRVIWSSKLTIPFQTENSQYRITDLFAEVHQSPSPDSKYLHISKTMENQKTKASSCKT